MPYITREDGERFIIPSYRDILSAKKPALLKKEILLLSTNYGEYITLQRKNVDQYEAAFSPEPGYLLGETVWHFFKRPKDLIYCEAIPNTTEAILVIVKGGSVYLDGSFPIDSIADELIIFRTQQNYFDIYIYGDIPLSQTPEEGKLSLDASSVKSFNILPEPIFQKLPTIKTFQLRLVDVVLKAHGIGVFPVKKLVFGIVLVALVWMGIMRLFLKEEELPKVFVNVINPNQLYFEMMMTPAPSAEIKSLTRQISRMFTIPGWTPVGIVYSTGLVRANLRSLGSKINILYQWARLNGASLQIATDGIYLNMPVDAANRPVTNTISPIQEVIAESLDRITTLSPGSNNFILGDTIDRGRFLETQLTINFSAMTLNTLDLLGEQFKGLPLVLVRLTASIEKGTLSGTIVLKAVGS